MINFNRTWKYAYMQKALNCQVQHPGKVQLKRLVCARDPGRAGDEMARELIEFCESRLSKIKCPRTIDFMDELPRTPTGKLIKRLLKAKYWPDQHRI